MIKEYFLLLLFLFIFSICANADYLTQDFLDEAIKDPSQSRKDLIFDITKLNNLRKYYSGPFINTNISQHYFEYGNYNVLLVTEKIKELNFVCDYLILEKLHPETHFANGPVEINDNYFNWEITVVVKQKWRGEFTDDIIQAFIVNLKTKKIEKFLYETIRLYSEV